MARTRKQVAMESKPPRKKSSSSSEIKKMHLAITAALHEIRRHHKITQALIRNLPLLLRTAQVDEENQRLRRQRDEAVARAITAEMNIANRQPTIGCATMIGAPPPPPQPELIQPKKLPQHGQAGWDGVLAELQTKLAERTKRLNQKQQMHEELSMAEKLRFPEPKKAKKNSNFGQSESSKSNKSQIV